MKKVGYLINYNEPGEFFKAECGIYYNYRLAGNGVFVEAEGPLLAVRVPIASCLVRGLPPKENVLSLTHGKIPVHLFNLAFDYFWTAPGRETYAAIVWDEEYHLLIPDQVRNLTSVKYWNSEHTILDLHSHGSIPARFSSQDDKDEQGLRLYGVCGCLDKSPEVLLRVGVYGYWQIISFCDVFDGPVESVLDRAALEEGEE